MRAALILALLATPASAACQGDEAFSCQIGTKTLDVCYWKGALIYRYGPEGHPELTIAEPLETVDYTPWPGIGSAFWDTVAFQNDGYTYEVRTNVERDPEATEPRAGGVRVMQGDATVAELTCNRGTATPMDGLYDLKTGIGQCWDRKSDTWGSCD